MQQMLELMQQQMKTVMDLQAENTRLREASQIVDRDTVPQTPRYRAKNRERPMVNASIDDCDWEVFIDAWDRYKRMCNLSDTDVDNVRLELRASCSSEVNKLLFQYVGSSKLSECSEIELLEHIRSIAVKKVHKEVHRLAFHALFQDQGEPVTQWVARLKAKACLCEFAVPCTCCTPPKSISYAEQEVAQRLVAGLRNREHTQRILSEASSLVTLEQKIERLQVLDTTAESASSLHHHQSQVPSETAAAKSSYKSGKFAQRDTQLTEESSQKCRWCGLPSHPGGKPIDKRTCPAQGKKCSKCKQKGHFARVCENSEASPGRAEAEVGDGNSEQLLALQSDASVSFSFGVHQQDFRVEASSTGGS